VVDQEPIRLWRRDYDREKQTVRIEWALAANSDTQWPKPEDAVVFSPDPKGRSCEVRGAEGKCLPAPPVRESRRYKYTLKAMDGKNTLVLDPIS